MAASVVVSFLDLVPPTPTFDVGGQLVSITPLSLREIADLGKRFEKLADLKDKPLIVVLKEAGPEAIGGIIAAGMGKPGDAAYEKKGADLSFGLQVDLVDAIIKASTPKGDGPLASALLELAGQVVSLVTAQAAIAAASSQNSLPSPSPASPASGADQKTSGT